MNILLSNDDGVRAPGLVALANALATQYTLQVIAPSYDRSGVSNSLTLDRPLQVEEHTNRYIGVDGTPTDCIHLGTSGMYGPVPDRVISGINYGANMGDDVLYSGTVAAAMEGRFLAQTPIAVSLATLKGREVNVDFEPAASIVMVLLEYLDTLTLPETTVLNINIPDLPAHRIKGMKFTTLGRRLKSENPVRTENPRGKTVYWIGRAGGPVENVPGTDFYEVTNGYVSITPIHADMTHEKVLAELVANDTAAVTASIAALAALERGESNTRG